MEGPQNLCGPQIRKLREGLRGDGKRHMTLEELAARMEDYGVSMSPAQLSKIERQRKHILDVQLVAVAQVFEVQICALFPKRSQDGSTQE